MKDARKAALVLALLERTEKGRQDWEPTVQPEAFRTLLGVDGGVEVCQGWAEDHDDEGDPTERASYFLVLFNANGQRVDFVYEVDLNTFVGETWVSSDALRQLHEAARKRALSADELVERFIGVLADAESASS